jgi:hypothetical protein
VQPNWDSDLVRAVQRDYPDDSDPFSAVNGFPYIPLTGFEPSHHLARRTFDDFA